MPTRSTRYPGELGRPIPSADLRRKLLNISASGGSPRQWLKDEVQRRLALLFAYYGIEEGPNCWERLAWSLANRHVPGLRTTLPSGRPPKERPGPLSTIVAAMTMKRRAGRRREWTLEMYCELLEDIQLGTEQLRKQGMKATIVGAIAQRLKEKNPELRPAAVREESRRLAKRFSEAKKISGNRPEIGKSDSRDF
jgi:hypothetical protein